MSAMRALIVDRRQLALALLALALLLKALIPAGFMVATSGNMLMVTICADSSGMAKTMALALPAKPDALKQAAQKGGACAFAGLADGDFGRADPLLLALAFAVILALGLAPTTKAPRTRLRHLLPPLRGPPVAA